MLSKCASPIPGIITWGLVSNAESQCPSQTYWTRICIFNKICRWFLCTFQFAKHFGQTLPDAVVPKNVLWHLSTIVFITRQSCHANKESLDAKSRRGIFRGFMDSPKPICESWLSFPSEHYLCTAGNRCHQAMGSNGTEVNIQVWIMRSWNIYCLNNSKLINIFVRARN